MSTYPEYMVAPMRQEMTDVGFKELKTAQDVESEVKKEGTTMVFVNSVCGCAAGSARPGVRSAIEKSSKKPTNLTTVFAGMEKEAVDKAREMMVPYPPSSPAIALFKNGELVHMIERMQIEGRSADMISAALEQAFEEYC
jgi:putative YphP/YqiW family bacilliredoxin